MSPWSFPEPPPACEVAACVWPGSLFFRPPACERSGPMCELSMTVEPVVEVEAVVEAAEASLRAAEKGAKHTSLLPRERNCTQQPPGPPENRTPHTAPAGVSPGALTRSAPGSLHSRVLVRCVTHPITQ